MKLKDILKEIKIQNPNKLSPKEIEYLNILTENFGEGYSGFDLYEPISEVYDLERIEEDEEDKLEALRYLLSQRDGIFLLKDLFDVDAPAIGAPPNAFYTRITIDQNQNEVIVDSPYLNEDERYSGWFESDQEYYPDIKNVNEKGEIIQ
jgi:hypothetical protein